MHYSDTQTSAPTWSRNTSLCSYVQQLPPRLGLERCISCYVVCFSKLHLHYLDTHSEQHTNQSISEWWGDDSAYLGRMVIIVHHFCLKIERSFARFFDFNPSWEKKVYFVCLYIYAHLFCSDLVYCCTLYHHTSQSVGITCQSSVQQWSNHACLFKCNTPWTIYLMETNNKCYKNNQHRGKVNTLSQHFYPYLFTEIWNYFPPRHLYLKCPE